MTHAGIILKMTTVFDADNDKKKTKGGYPFCEYFQISKQLKHISQETSLLWKAS